MLIASLATEENPEFAAVKAFIATAHLIFRSSSYILPNENLPRQL
jgi:hypothetical protein